MSDFPDHAQLANMALIEDLYARYQADPESVDLSWRHFFEGIDFGSYLYKRGHEPTADSSHARINDLIQAYRRYGHLLARFNPLETKEKSVLELDLEKLGFFASELTQLFPTLGFCGKKEAPLQELIQALQDIYCTRIGFEYMDLGNPELEKWVQSRIEPQLAIQPTIEEKHLLLDFLNKSEVFETFLHMKYVGQTRFSLEGAETMIPLLAEILDYGGEWGIDEVLLGMAHRGRLNVLTNILNKPLALILEEFEDDTTLSFAGNDDVRYHMGYTGEWKTRSGKKVTVSIAANPSHLESVDPVLLGQTYAKQILKKDEEKKRTAPILIHGDASIAGQGVVYESLQLMNLPAYSVGGCLHLVVNNQIGYTTLPEEGRSTRYCTDIAKAFSCPVFHVNAEDPESCLFAAKLAVEIREKFHCDVFIDLYCYRKYGHNEGDEPSFTQPVQYQLIKTKKTIREMYYEQLRAAGHLEQKMAEALDQQFKESLKAALVKAQEKIAAKASAQPIERAARRNPGSSGPGQASYLLIRGKALAARDRSGESPSFEEGVLQTPSLFTPFSTGVSHSTLKSVLEIFCKTPEGFHLHPKLQKWVADRLQATKIDWSTAECLAFGSLLLEKVNIRLAGQDSQRGTFSQRHMVWIDSQTNQPYCSLKQIQGARLDVINSPLTEYAGLGFEYGYTWSATDALVLWEAQYGDFNNGAQIIIDQYIACAEQKWNFPSSLTLLLPHGYEGAGPEHSSARMERFLDLGANMNMQVVYPSTPAQYFHLLRRQALRKVRKPLIIFTPKSLLRAPECVSPIESLTTGGFEEILDDPTGIKSCKRLIFCTGKIFYHLMAARKEKDVALIRIEQLYPLHRERLQKIIAKYKGFSRCLWVQEEPENMGAWNYMRPHLEREVGKIDYVGRAQNATTATGSSRKHKQEQALLLERAFEGL